mgnify:CR=1 FL=1
MTIITVKTGGIAADAVTDAKIADDVVGTEHLTANEVDTAALKADAVTAAQIADDAISEEHLDVTAITGHTAETTVADGDLVVVHDASASALRKMTVANLVANAGGGKILQVVGATETAARTITSTSFINSSNGITVNITPSATSSKIFVIVSLSTFFGESGQNLFCTIYRDSTNLGGSSGLIINGGFNETIPATMSFLDSPSSTSQITYQMYAKVSGGSSSKYGDGNSPSVITAFEVGA